MCEIEKKTKKTDDSLKERAIRETDIILSSSHHPSSSESSSSLTYSPNVWRQTLLLPSLEASFAHCFASFLSSSKKFSQGYSKAQLVRNRFVKRCFLSFFPSELSKQFLAQTFFWVKNNNNNNARQDVSDIRILLRCHTMTRCNIQDVK